MDISALFTCDPLSSRRPDYAYEDEYNAALGAGVAISLINIEALIQGDASASIRRVKAHSDALILAFYRGWMITPRQYADLHDALIEVGVRLVNTSEQYERCHCLPGWYDALGGHTPRSVWTAPGDVTDDAIVRLLSTFGSSAVMVKDYVKSRKHEWAEACYIPNAGDREAALKVVNRFVELQGKDLNGGVVLREFVDFEPIGPHSKSGMPLTREFRLFFLDGKLLQSSNYWDEGDYTGEHPPIDFFTGLAAKIESRFFTMDVARKTDGEWLVVELGDAQVADLPEDVDPGAFFSTLKSRL